MSIVRRAWECWALAGVVLAASGLACSSGGGGGATLPSFHDLTSAPAAIQTASRAVVRIHTAGEYGTGSFISPTGDGLLRPSRAVIFGHRAPAYPCCFAFSRADGRIALYQPRLRSSRAARFHMGKCAACHQCIS